MNVSIFPPTRQGEEGGLNREGSYCKIQHYRRELIREKGLTDQNMFTKEAIINSQFWVTNDWNQCHGNQWSTRTQKLMHQEWRQLNLIQILKLHIELILVHVVLISCNKVIGEDPTRCKLYCDLVWSEVWLVIFLPKSKSKVKLQCVHLSGQLSC